MIFSDGSYIPTFIIFSAIGIIIKYAPVEYPLFHKSFPFHSYYGFRFSLPVDINEKNWPHIKSIGSVLFFVFAALDLIVFVLGILNRSSTLYISCTQHLLLIGVSFSFGGMILAANKHKEGWINEFLKIYKPIT